MTHTIKFARHRAAQDPDRGVPENGFRGKGVYFGSNIPFGVTLDNPSETITRVRTTRGACA